MDRTIIVFNLRKLKNHTTLGVYGGSKIGAIMSDWVLHHYSPIKVKYS